MLHDAPSKFVHVFYFNCSRAKFLFQGLYFSARYCLNNVLLFKYHNYVWRDIVKLGIRTPNLKSRVKARTTGKLKRKVKRAVNPLYGKKGMGMLRNPKKSIYNRIYRRTTISADSMVGSTGGCLVGSLKFVALPVIFTLKLIWFIMYLPLKFLFYYPYVLIRNAIRKSRSKTISADPGEEESRGK